jgi:hypothetical protein
MRNDEMIRELLDNELDHVSGGYYCQESRGAHWVNVGCGYGSSDLAEDLAGTIHWAVEMGKPYY